MFARLASSTIFCLIAGVAAAADDFVELTIPLEDGRYYRRIDVEREIHVKLGGAAPNEAHADERFELSRAERAALLAAELTGTMKVQVAPDRLLLSVKRTSRRDLERLLQVDWGLTPPRRFDPRRRSVILIHGLESRITDLRAMVRAFEAVDAQVFTFEYPNDGPLALAGDRLSEDLKAYADDHRNFRAVIVAHSMGGLVARYCLETPGKNPGCVSHLFMLGTPHQGSDLAVGQEWLELVFNLTPRLRGKKWTVVNDGQGQAAQDLAPGSDFLMTLNRQTKPAGTEYHVGVGVKGFFSAQEQETLAAEVEQLLAGRGVKEERRQAIVEFLHSPELCTGQGDGAVTLASAELPGADSQHVFQLNHLELVQPSRSPSEDHPVLRWILDELAWRPLP